MRSILLPIVALLIFMSGCHHHGHQHHHGHHHHAHAPNTPTLTYHLTLPDTLPETVSYQDGVGPLQTANGEQIYRQSHRDGWDEFAHLFKNSQVVPGDASIEFPQRAEPLFWGQSRRQGFEDCRQAIGKLVEQFGLDATRNAIADPYQE